MTERKPRRDDVLELRIEGVDGRGTAFGSYQGHTVRVRGAAPGARVRVDVRKRRRSRVDAALLEVLEPGPEEVPPRCRHFGTCGGCSFQHLAYPAQLRLLEHGLASCLEPLGALGPLPSTEPIVGAEEPWHYRNKMDFTFGSRRWVETNEPQGAARDFALGLHVPGRFDKVLDVAHCDIAFREANPILASVRRLAVELGLDPWDVRAHRGLLRHLVLRKGVRTGEILADLVTTEAAPERVGPLVERLRALHPELTTVVQHVNPGVALVATGVERVLFGPGHVHETLAGLTFRVSAGSFFQTNTPQAERLVELVLGRALPGPGVLAFDLYCGSGLFSLALARAGARVTGFELVESAVQDARGNAARNGLQGLEFVAGDLAETLGAAAAAGARPDVCVVDPPRAGVHGRVVEALARLVPRRIVYVSCHPKSAVRDLAPLLADGYRLEAVQPVDLFPHTPHLECVFTVERTGGRGG